MKLNNIQLQNTPFVNRIYLLASCILILIINVSAANANIDLIIQSLSLDKPNDELLSIIEKNPRKQSERPSDLNSEMQKLELNKAITTMYSEDWISDIFWNNPQDKQKVQTLLGVSDDAYGCIIDNHNYDTFQNAISSMVDDYVAANSPEKIHDDLVILIDSGLVDEYHDLFLNTIEHEDETAVNLFQLHLLQDPFLRIGVQLQISDESLSSLIGMTKSDANKNDYLNTLPTNYLFQVITDCGA